MTSSSHSQMHPLRVQTVETLEAEINRLSKARAETAQAIKNLKALLAMLRTTTEAPATESPKSQKATETGTETSKLHEHPAIQTYRDVFRSYPQTGSYELITARVGAGDGDLAAWRETCSKWMLAGYNPKNVQGLIEMFLETVPAREGGGFTFKTIDGIPYRVYDDGDRVPASPTA